ncbi:hypothetical protein [Streptomyces sp. NPDC054787]
MADAAALYGLIGAVGGAVLGAGAAVTSSVLQTRTAERVRRRARAESEVGRLLALRKSTRVAVELLSDTVEALMAGRPPTDEEFRSAWQVAFDALRDAAENTAIDGLPFALSRSSGHEMGRRSPGGAQAAPNGLQLVLVPCIQSVASGITRALRDHRAGMPVERAGNGLRESVALVDDMRGQLLAALLDRMESLSLRDD